MLRPFPSPFDNHPSCKSTSMPEIRKPSRTFITAAPLLFIFFPTVSYSLIAFPYSTAAPSFTTILSNSGYLSMALTLQLTAKSLVSASSTATVFAPTDTAFALSGQPSLSLLQHHILPTRISIQGLRSLPHGSRLVTLLTNQSLLVTADHSGKLSLNGVTVNEQVIYDDGSIVVYGVDRFLHPFFDVAPSFAPEISPATSSLDGTDISRQEQPRTGFGSFACAADFLRTRGFSIMAACLDMQLGGIMAQTGLTIFAPVDDAIREFANNVSDYALVFRRHVVPRLLRWNDLFRLVDGTALPTLSDGFVIEVMESGDVLVLNDVPIVFPDMYTSDWLVVHGLNRLLVSPTEKEFMGESFSALDGDGEGDGYLNVPNYAEYGE